MPFHSRTYKDSLKQPAVLVVDDDKNIRRAIWLILKSEFDVTAVETGEKAIQEIEKGADFDVVSLDIRLPGISGIDTLKAIKELSPATEVLIITAHSDLETARAAIKLGAYDYLDKPFKKEPYRETVRKGVERRRKTRTSEEAEEQLAFVKAQLIQSERFSAMGELIAGVVHELNSPLSLVLGFSELLSSQKCSLKQSREYAKDIRKAAQLCQQVINKLLAFTRKKSVQEEVVQINEILKSTIDLKRNDLQVDKVEVTIQELDPDLPYTVADYHELQQVFLNIINNAHHAMKDQEKDRIITIRSEFDDKLIRIIFEDTGPGIPKDNLQKIFEPLFTTKEKGKGTGLGLSVCYEIMRKHKGNIYVASEPGQGACFVVALPIVANLPSPTQTTQAAGADVPKRTAKILLIDNNTEERDLLNSMISSLGYQLDVASDPTTAQEKAKSGGFDIVFLSLEMEEVNGHPFHIYLSQSQPEILQTTVLIVNGLLEEALKEFIRRFKTSYLIKPFGISDIEKAVTRIQAFQGSQQPSAQPET